MPARKTIVCYHHFANTPGKHAEEVIHPDDKSILGMIIEAQHASRRAPGGFARRHHRSGIAPVALCCLMIATPLSAGEADTLPFDIPAGRAAETLKPFAQQAKREIIFSVRLVGDASTNAVEGEFTVRDAIDGLLARTGLVAFEDEKTGAYAIKREKRAAETAGRAPSIDAPRMPREAAGGKEPDDGILLLSPFTVSARQDEGYSARYTLAGTRIRTDTRDVGSSISVITSKFLADTSATNAIQLLVYTANTEVSGPGGNFLGVGDDVDAGAVRHGSSRVRGLLAADNTRDFFLTDIPWDSYNTSRIDIQRGPNSVLFGIGSPAGIINASTNQAAFVASNGIETKIDNFGTVRFSGDFNRVLVDDVLAVRVSLLHDETKYRQEPAFRNDRRFYGAVRWDPSFLNDRSMRASLAATYERGKIESNLPRQAPPNDYLTPWFTQLGHLQASGVPFRTSTTVEPLNPAIATAAGDQLVSGGTITTYLQGAPLGIAYPHNIANQAQWVGGAFHQGITGYAREAWKRRLPGWRIAGFKNRVMTDRSIFDSHEHLLDGETKGEFADFDAYNVSFRQSFADETFGFELAIDRQHVHGGEKHFLNASGYGIGVDVMGTYAGGIIGGTPVPNGPDADALPDGTFAERADPINPMLGRAYVVGARGSGWSWDRKTKTSYRATGFYNLDFNAISGRDSMPGRVFGENRFTLLASRYIDEGFSAGGDDFHSDDGYELNVPGSPYFQASRTPVYILYYLSPGKLQGADPSGIDLPRMGGLPQTGAGRTQVRNFNPDTKRFDIHSFDLVANSALPEQERRYGDAGRFRRTVDSTALVWQGHWLGGSLIPMAAVRRDESFANRAIGLPRTTMGNLTYVSPFDPGFALGPDSPKSRVDSYTYSLVSHTPGKWREELPGRMNLQLVYNQSENFQPSPGRVDILNRRIPDPSGETREYGFAVSAFNDKVRLKVVRYETTVGNADIGLNSNINAWATAEVWARSRAAAHAGRQGPVGPGAPAGAVVATIYGYDSATGNPVTFRPHGPWARMAAGVQLGRVPDTWDGRSNGYGIWNGASEPYPAGTIREAYTRAEIDATYDMQKAAIDAVLDNPPPDEFLAATGIVREVFFSHEGPPMGGAAAISGRSATAEITGTSRSKGAEFELIANPIGGLSVVLNVARTEARRFDLAPGFVEYLEKRRSFFEGPAGNIRFWSASSADASVDPYSTSLNADLRTFFNTDVYSTVGRFIASENSNVPEMKPWSFNVIANYAFQGDGLLEGVNIGGGYRWLDRNVTGYPISHDDFGAEIYDTANPHYGTTVGTADFWIGYNRRISGNISWRMQLNIRNVFADDRLILASVNPDNSPAAYRIPEPRTFTLTNSIEF